MIRRILFPFLTLCTLLLPVSAMAQKIGYVDMQRALNEVDEGKRAKAELKSRFEKAQTQLDKEQSTLRAKKEELDKKRLAMDEATLRQKMGELDQELVRVSNLYAKLQKELSEAERKATAEIFGKMRKLVADIAKASGYGYVFEANESGLVYGQPSDDLTSELVRKYNATYKK